MALENLNPEFVDRLSKDLEEVIATMEMLRKRAHSLIRWIDKCE